VLGIGRFVKKKLGRKNLKIESMLKECLAHMENIDSRMQGFDSQMQGFDSQMQGFDSQMQGLDSQMQGLDSQMQGLDSQMQGFDSRLTEAEGRQREMLTQINLNLKEYHQGNFFNQIALACPKEGLVRLYMPWNDPDRNTINMERQPSGQLSFPTTPLNAADKKPVYVVTIPKSGTHVLLHALMRLGFTSDEVTFNPFDVIDYIVPYNAEVSKTVSHKFPYSLGARLRPNGTVTVGHVTDAGSIYAAHRDDKILLAVRDLRLVAVSFCRWVIHLGFFAVSDENSGHFPANSELDSSLMLDFFKKDFFQGVLAATRSYIWIRQEPFIRLVRFEELVSPDREVMRPSAEAIAEVAECSLEEVFQALEKTNGEKTATYSGQLSQLGNFWTQEVEDRFIELGGDVLNERLGYSRRYMPKS